MPTPLAINNSTIEAIHNPIAYTPYIHFDNVISELGKHNIATGGKEKSVEDIVEFPMETRTAEIQSIRNKCEYLVNDSPFNCIGKLCSDRANNDNRIHQRDVGIPTRSGDIQYQIRNDQSCLDPETAGNFLSLPTAQTTIGDIELRPPRSKRKVFFLVTI